MLVIDPSKITAMDPKTGAPTFKPDIGDELDQGAIVDTPAVGDITGDGKPEIVVGTNEEYPADSDGGLNAGLVNTASLTAADQVGRAEPGQQPPVCAARGRRVRRDPAGLAGEGRGRSRPTFCRLWARASPARR